MRTFYKNGREIKVKEENIETFSNLKSTVTVFKKYVDDITKFEYEDEDVIVFHEDISDYFILDTEKIPKEVLIRIQEGYQDKTKSESVEAFLSNVKNGSYAIDSLPNTTTARVPLNKAETQFETVVIEDQGKTVWKEK